jgi:chemotaxis protein CheD
LGAHRQNHLPAVLTTMLSRKSAARAEPSKALPGFSHVARHWDREQDAWSARILPGQYYVTLADELIDTVLGSCVAACIRDPIAGVGGMNHFMLPESANDTNNSWLHPTQGLATRYGSFAMESLVNELQKHGAERARLEVKLFGGGKILDSTIDVGARNAQFAREFVRLEGFTIAAEDLGDIFPRKVIYDPQTGRVRVKRLNSIERARVVGAERSYAATVATTSSGNDVELFD